MDLRIYLHKENKMIIKTINYRNISFSSQNNKSKLDSMDEKINEIGKRTVLPNGKINYCIFNERLVKEIANKKEVALPYIEKFLERASDEKEIVEGLYILDCMIENGTKGVERIYPTISRFNESESPNVQVFLAGVYRKIQVPDAFGPLCSMLIRNSIKPNRNINFDPNEEVGGAILEYIRNRNATETYKN